MDTLFKSSTTFASLSLKDLIEARDLFHYHLINKKNVVATALGLYRIRKHDPWPTKQDPNPVTPKTRAKERRTLFNSEVRPYSWPCVYAFVSDWELEGELAETNPTDVVPKCLYLPDGRSVPVCVIEARQQAWSTDLRINAGTLTPRNLLAPGMAILNEDGQGMTRLATAGCIVRDGERYYVLTNRHVVGRPNTPIKALQNHRTPEIGASSDKGLTRVDFGDVYPNFRSTNQRLLMDVGLVAVDDILQWKTEVPGIAPVGPILDLYDNSLSLKLITMKVVGQAAISGLIRGEIHGLFYRYKAMGGSEYMSDFLIGPETYGLGEDRQAELESIEKKHAALNVSLAVHHGDSGTLLFIEHNEPAAEKSKPPKKIHYPFALLWGKEEFFADDGLKSHPYALATALSTALDRLDLDLVQDINRDETFIWGWAGHYVIGRALGLPVDLLDSDKLKTFVSRHLSLLAIEPDDALGNDPKVLSGDSETPNFVPLADVPDNVWKSNVNFTLVDGSDGKKHHKPGPGSRGQNDNPNHFADLDIPEEDGVPSFLQRNLDDPDTHLNPEAWVAYFASKHDLYKQWAQKLGKPDNSKHWGALPFRVHQLFDTMVKAANDGDEKLFLCAGGVMIHYVGDACQPLHASYLSQGDPDRVLPRPHGATMKLEADGVHSGYEDEMIAHGFQNENLVAKLKTRIKDLKSEAMPDIANGYDAAKSVIALIAATQAEIAPRAIVDRWVELSGTKPKAKAQAMWETFGDDTITCMARGTRYLTKLWQAAWTLGDGDTNLKPNTAIKKQDLIDLYNDPDVVPSIPLNQYPPQDQRADDWSGIKRIVHP